MSGSVNAQPLTRLITREQEMAELIAGGLSNREIAAKLVVSTRTAESQVQVQVQNILIKLGFTSRAQIASYLAAGRHQSHERAAVPSILDRSEQFPIPSDHFAVGWPNYSAGTNDPSGPVDHWR